MVTFPRALKIVSDFDTEVFTITKKYVEAGQPISLIKSVISVFKKRDDNQPIIPDRLFEERGNILFKLPYYEVKRFIMKIKSFSEGKIIVIDLWTTRNIKSLFLLKDKAAHRSCVIYLGKCSRGLS